MASLASSAVTEVAAWTAGGVNGKRHVEGYYDLVLTGQGDATDKILASALGLTKVERCGNAVASDNSAVYPAVPSYDGSAILLTDLTDATDGTRAAPANATGVTVRIFVAGYR